MPGKSKKGGGLESTPAKNLQKGYSGVKPNPPANMGSAYKMKNSALHMGAKHGTPIQANYNSPAKDGIIGGTKSTQDRPIIFDTPGTFDVFKNNPDDVVRVYSDSKTQKSYVTPYERISDKESKKYKPDSDIVKDQHGNLMDMGSKKKRKEYHATVRKYRNLN